MADLSWKVKEIKYNCDSVGNNWVSVNPSYGSGSENVTITVSAASSKNDCDSATVVFSASTGDIRMVNVSRCLPECNCKTIGFTGETLNLSSDAATHIRIGGYSPSITDESECFNSIVVITDGIVLTNPSRGSGNVYADVNANTGGSRTGWYRLQYHGEICIEQIVTQMAAGQTRWVKDGTMCDGYDKYKKEKEQKSEDGGYTWVDTGNTRKGDLIEEHSRDCGWPPPTPTHCEIDGHDEIDSCSGGTEQYTIIEVND